MYSIYHLEHYEGRERVPGHQKQYTGELAGGEMQMLNKVVIMNLKRSLGWEIREVTRTLRHQQKEYFNKIKTYESESGNKEIQLTETQREKMKDLEDESQIYEEIDKQRDQEINKLVASINGLTMIYKEMANLVMQQGTLIDRIDYNIDKAMDHT